MLWAGEAAQTHLRGAGGSLAASRPAGDPLPLAQAHAVFSGCFRAEPLPEAGRTGHCPPLHCPKEPLGKTVCLCAGGCRAPKGSGIETSYQRGVSAPRETRGKECASACEESALGFPWRGVRAAPLSCQPSRAASSWALPSPPSQLRARLGAQRSAPSRGKSQSSSSPWCTQGFCLHLLQALKGSHLITFPAHVVISLAAGMGQGRKGKAWSCTARCWGQFALLGCPRLEITAGASPRQTAPGAGHHPLRALPPGIRGAKAPCGYRVTGEGQRLGGWWGHSLEHPWQKGSGSSSRLGLNPSQGLPCAGSRLFMQAGLKKQNLVLGRHYSW